MFQRYLVERFDCVAFPIFHCCISYFNLLLISTPQN
nr:MAG TPA: hypothetical protein [Caudoviricetes sp.]